MSRIGKAAFGVVLGALLMTGMSGAMTPVYAQDQAAQKPAYTTEEYNAYIKAHGETDPQQKIKQLDDFVAKYPNSALLIYIYNDYYQTYYALKDFPNTIKYIDKLLSLGDKLDLTSQLNARLARAQTFNAGVSLPEINTPPQLSAARDSAQQGLTDLGNWQKPANVTDDQFAQQKKNITGVFDTVIATADYALKDWKASAGAYKTLVGIAPDDAASWARLGVSLLQENPPQTLDGYWAVAKAISLKPANEAQLRTYLKSQIVNYQQLGCDNLADDEINNMVTLAASSPDRPSTFTLPTSDDLQKSRADTANFLAYLRAGGDQGKMMWLATCGLEFPEVVAKVISVDAPDSGPIVLHLCTGATPDETEACKTPDMEVKVPDQPDAKRVKPDDGLRFDATLVGYDQNPFMLHWEKGKVNPEDIPAANDTKKRPVKH